MMSKHLSRIIAIRMIPRQNDQGTIVNNNPSKEVYFDIQVPVNETTSIASIIKN